MDVRTIYRTCPACGRRFGQPDDPGRKRRFCSDACKQAAYRARGATHHQALRALGNRLVGILHGCLARRIAYQEQVAWPTAKTVA